MASSGQVSRSSLDVPRTSRFPTARRNCCWDTRSCSGARSAAGVGAAAAASFCVSSASGAPPSRLALRSGWCEPRPRLALSASGCVAALRYSGFTSASSCSTSSVTSALETDCCREERSCETRSSSSGRER